MRVKCQGCDGWGKIFPNDNRPEYECPMCEGLGEVDE